MLCSWFKNLSDARAINCRETGSIGAAIAYQNGPSSMIGKFDFAYVGFAVVWGVVFFAEIPDVISGVGMVLIVIAGFLSLRQ